MMIQWLFFSFFYFSLSFKLCTDWRMFERCLTEDCSRHSVAQRSSEHHIWKGTKNWQGHPGFMLLESFKQEVNTDCALFHWRQKTDGIKFWYVVFFVWVKLYKSISWLKREQFLNCSSLVWRCYWCWIGGLFFFTTENKHVRKNLWPDVSWSPYMILPFARLSPRYPSSLFCLAETFQTLHIRSLFPACLVCIHVDYTGDGTM